MSDANSKENFEENFDRIYKEASPNFDEHVNIAFVGKVSTGKSSLLNAILGRTREDPIAAVGAKSGVTTKVNAYKLDEQVLICDCPGLNDIRKENSEETNRFLNSIDLGIFVVTGSSDSAQKSNFDDLRNASKKAIVVINKIDEWDDLEESAYKEVVDQWKKDLDVDQIFGTCTKGFDPQFKKGAAMDLRGVAEVRDEIFIFLRRHKKDILLARHLRNKNEYAIKLIAAALVAVAGEAFIPGSAAYITATQLAAITSLHYVYKGKALDKSAALALLPSFVGESLGTNIFLWAKSFLPPTGVVDIAAAFVAVTITFAMLAAVKWMLENQYELDKKDSLKGAFNEFKEKFKKNLKDIDITDLKNPKFVFDFLLRILNSK